MPHMEAPSHAGTASHVHAVAALIFCDACGNAANVAADVREAPNANEFMDACGTRRRNDNPGGVRSTKQQQLEFCVAEAMRMQDHEHFVRVQDARGARVRYVEIAVAERGDHFSATCRAELFVGK